MDKTITAAEANRRFSALLRGVREGATYVVTSHGRPVARIVPMDGDADERARRERAKRDLLKRLRGQPALNLPRITRDEMHERSAGAVLGPQGPPARPSVKRVARRSRAGSRASQ